jgi:tetratricopeptide (TPR) repeat protein
MKLRGRQLLGVFVLSGGLSAAGALMLKGLDVSPTGTLVEVNGTSRARAAAPVATVRDRAAPAPAAPQDIGAKSPELAEWMQRWTTSQLDGKRTSDSELGQLLELIETKSIPLADTIDSVCMISSMDGDANLKPLCEHIVSAGQLELQQFQPADPNAKPLVDRLLRVHEVLWKHTYYELDQKLIELVRPWEVRGSGHSQLMSYLYAECLQYQGRPLQAYEAFVDAAAEREKAFEPSLGTNSSLDLEMGKMLFLLMRYEEAEDHLKAAATPNRGADLGDVLTFLSLSLTRQNKLDEARTYINQFYEQKCSSVLEQQMQAEWSARTSALASAARSGAGHD